MWKIGKIGLAYYKVKNSPYMPKIELTNRLYMPISQKFEEGFFVKLTWRF